MIFQPRIIALTGPKMCGKDTMAKVLTAQNWNKDNFYTPFFKKTPMASGVKNICELVFGWSMGLQDDPLFKETLLEGWPFIEPRWAMMDIANFMRDKYGPDVWVHALRRHIGRLEHEDRHGAYIITDLRFPNELAWLKRNPEALVIYVHRTEAEEKLAKAQATGDPKALNPSEAHYEEMRKGADLVLSNDAEIYKAQNDLVQAVRGKYKHWIHWGVNNLQREGEYK